MKCVIHFSHKKIIFWYGPLRRKERELDKGSKPWQKLKLWTLLESVPDRLEPNPAAHKLLFASGCVLWRHCMSFLASWHPWEHSVLSLSLFLFSLCHIQYMHLHLSGWQDIRQIIVTVENTKVHKKNYYKLLFRFTWVYICSYVGQ